jgi:mevalonate kinase
MNNRYYANGKLLISGEYLVSRGAKALVVPLKVGQWLEVESRPNQDDPCLIWQARELDHDWFSAVIRLPHMEVSATSDATMAGRLVELLIAVSDLHDGVLNPGYEYRINTQTTFDHNWGLGTSSSLIANMAQWAQVNPYELFFRVSGGSGYDVAAALARGPIVYSTVNQRIQITPVRFFPSFRHNIWFAYQGNKQDTAESLDIFNRKVTTSKHDIEFVNAITRGILHAGTLIDFMHQMHEQEAFLSRLLGMKPVKEEYFGDFRGEIKSLGAWGGDFIMIASDQPEDYIKSYFTGKGRKTIFSFEELVLI